MGGIPPVVTVRARPVHIQLTDILTCPACGPHVGLIVRADRILDRRVREGALGCPSCRRQYPIRNGVAHLMVHSPPGPDATEPGPAGETLLAVGEASGDRPRAAPAAASAGAQSDAAMRIAALLGLGESGGQARGFVALVGAAALYAADVAALVPGQEIVAVDSNVHATRDAPGVSRIVIDAALPFYDEKLRGIWLAGAMAGDLLEDAARALHPLGRLVLEPAPRDAQERLAAHELRVLAHERETVLAARM